MTSNDFLTPKEILADVLMYCNDSNLRSGFTEGWYLSCMERALASLAYTTFFDQRACIVKLDTKKLFVNMPEGLFNIREIYGGELDCDGAFIKSLKLYNKRLYNNMGKGKHYTANVKEGQSFWVDEPYYEGFLNDTGFGNIFYYGLQNGMIMVSRNCCRFTHLKIVANGTGVLKLGDTPMVLRVLREAVISWICREHFAVRKGKERAFKNDWMEWDLKWKEDFRDAKKFILSMDTAAKSDLINYMSELGINNLW